MVVSFPFSEKYYSKEGPAVILSDEVYCSFYPNLVLAMVTSAKISGKVI